MLHLVCTSLYLAGRFFKPAAGAMLICAVCLGGCATRLDQAAQVDDVATPGADEGSESSSAVAGSAVESEADTVSLAEPELPSKPFAIETFYALLVAEVASDRRRYDVWLANYVQEAHRTRDPGVAAQAARVAQFLNARQAALNTTLLWLELEPENSEALYMATTELANAGRLLESFKYSEELLRKGSVPIFQTIAARASQSTDTQFERLSAEFDRLIPEYPNNPPLLLGKATLLHIKKELRPALELVQQVVSEAPEDMTAAIMEARLLMEVGDTDLALSRLLALLQQHPDNQRVRLQYARMLANIDLEEARKQFDVLTEQSPNNPDLLYSLALIANELGDVETSRSVFSKLLVLGAYENSAHYYLGVIAEDKEEFDRALEHFQLVESGPEFLPALSRAIELQIRIGELRQAHQRIENLQAQFPDQSSQFILLEAQALAKFQYLQQAEGLLTEALTFDPNNADILYSRAMINEQRDLIDLMESDLRTIIRYQPNNAGALNALGYVLANRTTRYDEALDLIAQALDIKPDDPAIIDSMGWVQFRLGNYDEALIRLKQALQAFPDPEIAAHLGEVLWVMGEEDEALQIWNDALKADPASNIIPGVMRRLEADSPR